jgi:hypothetical protein
MVAKRKTIGVNPLDPLVPGPKPDQPSESPATAQARSAGPSAGSALTATSGSRPKVKDSTVPAPASQVAQPPSPADLVNRVQSLEKENEFIKWLVGGAILLAIML